MWVTGSRRAIICAPTRQRGLMEGTEFEYEEVGGVVIRAVWNGVVLAEVPRTVRVEGNHYFPPESLHRQYFSDSRTKSLCPWKGIARYYTVTVDGAVNSDAGWYYPNPSPLARRIKNHVALSNGVRIEGEAEGGRRLSERVPGWLRGKR